jgi:Protein of unknown function, DUF547
MAKCFITDEDSYIKRFAMLKTVLFVPVAALALLTSCTNAPPLAQSATPSATTFSDESYGKVLKTYVNAKGLVNYPALQANPQPLKTFVASLGTVSPSTYAAWNEPEKIAFQINAYNAITLESIIDQKPLKKSIKDIGGVWNGNKHRVLGESKTLDDIEHQILRKQFTEPRIHAALVCAAMSCPPLRQEPYTGAKLNVQLDDQVRQWLSSRGLQIDRAQNKVQISNIFDWYGDDWKKQYSVEGQFAGNDKQRATLNFIGRYVSSSDRDYLAQGKYKLGYLNYDWSLNRQ